MTELKSSPELKRTRVVALVADLAWLVGTYSLFGSILFTKSRWGILTHLGIPLLLYPLYAYLSAHFIGATPGQLLLGLRDQTPDGKPPQRIYDWLFQSRLRFVSAPRSRATLMLFAFSSAVFAFGGSTVLWMRDPTLRPFQTEIIPLFAPDAATKAQWDVLPFYYATGAFPRPSHPAFTKGAGGLEYSLPYERGPPTRFLGRIVAHWRDLDSRLIITGPVTAASPSNQKRMRRCFLAWFGCVSTRRQIWKASIAPYFDDQKLVANEWFEVNNGFLPPDERPRGIYLRSRPERGRLREAYFVVNSRMALQGFVLDRPVGELGDTASDLLAKTIGSLRLSSDLQAPRAFINPKIAGTRLREGSSLKDLISAEALLLAKVSIDPKESESFYHLAGLAITLFRQAKKEGRIELAATSKMIVTNSLQYIRDVNPKSPHIPQMERFDAETESN